MDLKITTWTIETVKAEFAEAVLLELKEVNNNNLNNITEEEISDAVHLELDQSLIHNKNQDDLSVVYDTASRDVSANEAFSEAFILLHADVVNLVTKKINQLKIKPKSR